MLCALLSLLTKATELPRATVTFFGLTVLFAIVIVVVAVLGPVEFDPPQAATARAAAHGAARNQTLM
jgi:Zn-dependent membrane protease YugP